MLVIRFQRVGKKHKAAFRIVLQDSRWKPGGKVLELLGFYDPHTKEKKFQAERITHWISKGAQPSSTVHNLFIDGGIITGEKVKAWKAKPGSKKEAEAKTESVSVVEEASAVV